MIQIGPYGLLKKINWRFSKTIKILYYLIFIQNKQIIIKNNQASKRFSFVNLKFFDYALLKVASPVLKEADEILNGYYYVHDFEKVYWEIDTCPWGTWENGKVRSFHRHDFFITLARAIRQSGEEKYKIFVKKLIKNLPEHYSIHQIKKYDKSIDIAIRILNWTAICSLIEKNDWADKELNYWHLQVEWMLANLSPGGNHRLLEGLGLFAAGSYFSDLGCARKWQKIGQKIVIAEMNLQVSDEGVHLEQSMYYHQICSTHFLKFYLICQHTSFDLSIEFKNRFQKMLEYIYYTQKPDGTHPMIGDGDQLKTNDREHWEARALIPICNYLFKLFIPVSDENLESLEWFICTKNYSILRGQTHSYNRQTKIYKNSGHAILREGIDNYLFFNCGPTGYKPYPHHGHSDGLGVEICLNGKTIIMDPGGYGYFNDEYRNYFRSTFSHNTVIIDGKNQSEIFGVFGFGKMAKVKLNNYRVSNDFDFIEGWHDGYAPVIHKRQIFYIKKPAHYILIVDFVIGDGKHIVEIPFHFAPGCDVESNEKYISLFNKKVKIWNFASSETSFYIIDKGSAKNNYIGLVSPHHSELSPSQVLIYKAHTFLSYCALTIFSPTNSVSDCKYYPENNELLVNNQNSIDKYFIKLKDSNVMRKSNYEVYTI